MIEGIDRFYSFCDQSGRQELGMEEIDIYRSAKLYIDQYGVDASVHAAMKADAMLERGDLDGFSVWMRIGREIEDMQANAGGTRH